MFVCITGGFGDGIGLERVYDCRPFMCKGWRGVKTQTWCSEEALDPGGETGQLSPRTLASVE